MESPQRINVAQLIDERPIGLFQVTILALCAFVLILDGYDIGAISSTAPMIADSLGLKVSSFGPIFSAGFVGVLIGALIFGSLADRVGRKAAIVVATFVFGVFTLLLPYVHSYNGLFVVRFLAGIGIGGAVPNAIALTSEFVPSRLRAFAVNLISAGIACGGVSAPVITSLLLRHYGWRPTFFIGGILPIALAIVLAFALPESIRFLAIRKPADPRLNRLVMRLDPSLRDARSFAVIAESGESASLGALFAERRGAPTLLLWVINFCSLLVALLMVSWLPALLREVGLTMATGLRIASLFSVGGILGTIVLGYTMIKRVPCMVLMVANLLAACAVAAFGSSGSSRPLLASAIFVAGFFVLGGNAAVLAVASGVYPTAIRSTGVGWTLGVGRLGSIVGPVVGGILIASHMNISNVFIIVAIPALIGALASFLLHRILASETTITLTQPSPAG